MIRNDDSEDSSPQNIPYLSRLPHCVLDCIIEQLSLESLNSFRSTSREFYEYVRLNRHRFNFVHKISGEELSILQGLNLSVGIEDSPRTADGLDWEERFVLNHFRFFDSIIMGGLSASEVNDHLIPFFRRLGLTGREWHLLGMSEDAVLSLCRSSFTMELCWIFGERFESTLANKLVKDMQESPNYAIKNLSFNLNEVSREHIADLVLNDVRHIKIWDLTMHEWSAFQNIDVSQQVESGLRELYMIERNSSMAGYESKGRYGLLRIDRNSIGLQDLDFVHKNNFLDHMMTVFDVTVAGSIIENLIPW